MILLVAPDHDESGQPRDVGEDHETVVTGGPDHVLLTEPPSGPGDTLPREKIERLILVFVGPISHSFFYIEKVTGGLFR